MAMVTVAPRRNFDNIPSMSDTDLDPRLTAALFSAIDQANALFPPDKQVERSLDAGLYGGTAGVLDSIQLVSLIVAVEENIQEAFGVAVQLSTAKAFSQKNSPFRTVRSLAEFAQSLVRPAANV